MEKQNKARLATISGTTIKTNGFSLSKQAAIDAFKTEALKLVKPPATVSDKTYNDIGAAIVAAIEAYIAPLITANNTHKHKIVIEDMGIDAESGISDTPVQ